MSTDKSDDARELLRLSRKLRDCDAVACYALRTQSQDEIKAALKAIREDLARFLEVE